MLLPDYIHPSYCIVKINKNDQNNKRSKIENLYTNTLMIFMKRNMQYGEVVMAGDIIKKKLNDNILGKNLIFSHIIEGTMQKNFDKSEYLFSSDDLFHYYLVPEQFIYGYDYGNGHLIPMPDYVFASKMLDNNLKESNEADNDFIICHYKENREITKQKLDDYKQEIISKSKSARNNFSLLKDLKSIEDEMIGINKTLNKKKILPFVCGDDLIYYLFIGDAPTTIEYNSNEYYILRKKYVHFHVKHFNLSAKLS